MMLFFLLAAGVYFRQFWAYVAAVYLLVAVLLAAFLRWIIPADLVTMGLANYDPAIQNFVVPLVSGLGVFVRVLILTGSFLALFYAVFKAGSDFIRLPVRQVAALTKEPKTATDFNVVARRFAQKGLWATAVLHWQHAAAKAPQQWAYQESLGRAYAKLGFYERSLDILQSVHKQSSNTERQATIQKLIQAIQVKMVHQSQQAKQS